MDKTFTIQQTAQLTKLSAHTLRYYEKIGLLPEIRRDQNGYREYTESDIAWIHFLLRLRETGMSIENMKTFSSLRSQGNETAEKRRDMLKTHRRKIAEDIGKLQANLEKIDDKIDYYESLVKAADSGSGNPNR
ncbi:MULTISPECIES: MerR family transcriptional regulator [Bacillus]|uniref:MerR family transcriptional regulator n=1 Tax=Bacillus glycinifermentans TaxID=1664069 RepID=A0AAJ3YWB4_9BACI|nr:MULTISPECIES: MerR family transcriptional regulator [Bacillus]MDU0073757.1 MerR family transcriptional regulator [Bacillus sp. IG6]MED8021649.1 MerR family transcriptional regulator [Bacillus glycinifermentans]QAT63948.1 MerR family transcriptional regulator [Bacillus glycinifermentans]WKB77829.1 MerR family transcriptional regulator [Bacillus glycinifermentans]